MFRKAIFAMAVLLALATVAAAAGADPIRVSVADDGTPGAAAANGGALSANGRFVAFTSRGRLTAAATGGRLEIYVRDRLTGRTVLGSASASGTPAGADVQDDPEAPPYALSGDGRYLVFASTATDLVVPDANGTKMDVFRKDLATGAIVLVDRNDQGDQAGDAVGGDPDVSGDGNRVVFLTGAAANLVPGDLNGASDAVVRDLDAGTTALASQSSDGREAAGPVLHPSISADGSSVAFEASPAASNLVPGDVNGTSDVVVRDLLNSRTVLASVATDGGSPGDAHLPDISGDGRYVAFESPQAYTPGDGNGASDVLVRDMSRNATILASAGGSGPSRLPAISADGSRVAFESTAPDLLASDANGSVSDVYVRDLPSGPTQRVSARADGGQGARAATDARLSPNGAVAGFLYDDGSPSQPLVAGDANQLPDVFTRDLGATDVTPPSITWQTPEANAAVQDRVLHVSGRVSDRSGVASLTLDGRRVPLGPAGAFASDVELDVGSQDIALVATDGAGNEASVSRTVVRALPEAPPAAVPVRARLLRAILTPRRRLRVRYALSGPARRASLRLYRPGPPGRVVGRLSWRRLAGPATAPARAGRQWARLAVPALSRGRYQVRITVWSDGGVTQATLPFSVLRAVGSGKRRA